MAEKLTDAVRRDLVGLSALKQQVLADLDMAEGGIGWWVPYQLKPWQRILISDYLLSAMSAVESQLLQAARHAQRHGEKTDALNYKYRQDLRAGLFSNSDALKFLVSSLDDGDLHEAVTAFFVAVVGALDNLAAVIVGVGGLEVPISRASAGRGVIFGDSEKGADKQRLPSGSPGRRAQDEYLTSLQAAFLGEPGGWLQWANEMRNLRVHRGQRVNLVQADNKTPPVLFRALPRYPNQTDVEAWSHADIDQVYLDEDAVTTVRGVLTSTMAACRATVASSVALWDRRRSDPTLIPQPDRQWMRLEKPASSFRGFGQAGSARARRRPTDLSSLHLSPEDAHRLKAARVVSGDALAWQRWREAGD